MRIKIHLKAILTTPSESVNVAEGSSTSVASHYVMKDDGEEMCALMLVLWMRIATLLTKHGSYAAGCAQSPAAFAVTLWFKISTENRFWLYVLIKQCPTMNNRRLLAVIEDIVLEISARRLISTTMASFHTQGERSATACSGRGSRKYRSTTRMARAQRTSHCPQAHIYQRLCTGSGRRLYRHRPLCQ